MIYRFARVNLNLFSSDFYVRKTILKNTVKRVANFYISLLAVLNIKKITYYCPFQVEIVKHVFLVVVPSAGHMCYYFFNRIFP